MMVASRRLVSVLIGFLIAGAASLASAAPLRTAAATPCEFRFIQITDTHLGEAEADRNTRKVIDAVNAISLDIAFVAHTGDIMADRMLDAGAVAAATGLLARLKQPVHYVPGNHDIIERSRIESMRVYTNSFGPLISCQEYHGVRMIFVYTEPLAKGVSIPGYDPIRELENCLKAGEGKPAIVFHHAPCVEDFYRNRAHSGWKAEKRDRWIELVNAYDVKAVIAGHFHRSELHWLGKVPLYVGSSVANYWGRQPSFRIYRYRDGRLDFGTVYIR